MKEQNVQLSERTVRYHLKLMDERGLTKLIGRRDGRIITSLGLDEINNARVRDKISLSISRIDVLSFKTTFDLKKDARSGARQYFFFSARSIQEGSCGDETGF